MKRIFIITGLALATVGLAGCPASQWDQVAYQTLAASQATINQAQADYTAKTIPQTQASYNAIAVAVKDQNAAVTLLVSYEEAKAAGGTPATLATIQSQVTVALATLPADITAVKALYTGVK